MYPDQLAILPLQRWHPGDLESVKGHSQKNHSDPRRGTRFISESIFQIGGSSHSA